MKPRLSFFFTIICCYQDISVVCLTRLDETLKLEYFRIFGKQIAFAGPSPGNGNCSDLITTITVSNSIVAICWLRLKGSYWVSSSAFWSGRTALSLAACTTGATTGARESNSGAASDRMFPTVAFSPNSGSFTQSTTSGEWNWRRKNKAKIAFFGAD